VYMCTRIHAGLPCDRHAGWPAVGKAQARRARQTSLPSLLPKGEQHSCNSTHLVHMYAHREASVV